jgi:Response regulator containing a CheY-like receiver domain and an HD-GYP domain
MDADGNSTAKCLLGTLPENRLLPQRIMNINLIETLTCVSKIVDLIHPKLNLHHVRTAFIAWNLARESHFSPAQCRKTLLAALLHDIGGLNEESRLEPLSYCDNELNDHALIGGELLAGIPLLSPLSNIVRYHHTRWESGKGRVVDGEIVPEESHIIYLADRIDVLLARYRAENISAMREVLTEIILDGSPSVYKPEYIESFRKMANRDHFWQVMQSSHYQDYISEIPRIPNDTLSLHNFRDISSLLAFVIDEFSEDCVQHSLTVGRLAGYLAKEAGIAPEQCLKVEIGGLLHNMNSLDRYGEQSSTHQDEQTWQVLSPIEGIEEIAEWCRLLPALNEKNACPFEVHILQASHHLAAILNIEMSPAMAQKRLAERTFFPPSLARLIHRRGAVLVQIAQESAKERRELMMRITQLNNALHREKR